MAATTPFTTAIIIRKFGKTITMNAIMLTTLMTSSSLSILGSAMSEHLHSVFSAILNLGFSLKIVNLITNFLKYYLF